MSVEDKKIERSKAKMAVTVASRRLIGAVNRENEYEILKTLMIDLEKAYDDFCSVNEEFEIMVCQDKYAEHRVVNGEDIKTYKDGVYHCYQDARKVYVYVKRETEESYRKRTADPIKVALKNDIRRIHELITVIDNNLELENINADVLQLDKAELQSMLNVVCENVNKLNSIESHAQDLPIQNDVDEIVSEVYNCTRKINLYMHEQSFHGNSIASNSTEADVVQVSKSDASSQAQPPIDHTSYITQAQGSSDSPSTMHPTMAQVPMTTPSTMDPTTAQVPMTTASTMHPTTAHVPMTTPSTMDPTTAQVPMTTASTMHPTTAHAPMTTPSTMHPTMAQVTRTPPSTMHPTIPEFNTTLLSNLAANTLPSSAYHATSDIGDSSVTQNTRSLNSAAQNFIPQNEATSSFGQPLVFQQSQVLAGSDCNPTGIQASYRRIASTTSNPVIYTYPYSSLLPAASSPTMYPTYTQVRGPQPVTSSQSYTNLNRDSGISLKRMTLPTFSGLRRDWPEFKAVWKSIAETSNYNKTALAHELKKSVKGEAKLRIKSVYITKPEAYNLMWEKLELYYKDTSASVQAALVGLQKLKPVKDKDYKGLVELVDEIESAYSQLDELKRLSTLTMRDVDFISELLPTHLKVDWRRKYRDLSPDDKLQPFKSFMAFLERERSVVARLAEIQQPRRRDRWSGHSNHVEGGSRIQRAYHKCAFPTHRKETIKHTTEQCKEFTKSPVSGKDGKYELLKQVNALRSKVKSLRRSE